MGCQSSKDHYDSLMSSNEKENNVAEASPPNRRRSLATQSSRRRRRSTVHGSRIGRGEDVLFQGFGMELQLNASKEEAEEFLDGMAPFSFVLRRSNGGAVTLSYVLGQHFRHVPLERDAVTGEWRFPALSFNVGPEELPEAAKSALLEHKKAVVEGRAAAHDDPPLFFGAPLFNLLLQMGFAHGQPITRDIAMSPRRALLRQRQQSGRRPSWAGGVGSRRRSSIASSTSSSLSSRTSRRYSSKGEGSVVRRRGSRVARPTVVYAQLPADPNADSRGFDPLSSLGPDRSQSAKQNFFDELQPWYQPDFGRAAAEKFLAGRPRGSFVVRPSARGAASVPQALAVLSLSHVEPAGNIGHCLLAALRQPGAPLRWIAVGGGTEAESLPALLVKMSLFHNQYGQTLFKASF